MEVQTHVPLEHLYPALHFVPVTDFAVPVHCTVAPQVLVPVLQVWVCVVPQVIVEDAGSVVGTHFAGLAVQVQVS